MSKEYTRQVTVLGNIPISGQVIYHDDFEGPLKWAKVSGIGDSIFELNPSIAKQGSQCLHLKTRTTDATDGDVITAKRSIHLLPSKVLAFTASFNMPFPHTALEYLEFLFTFFDGAASTHVRIRHRPNNPDWAYFNTEQTYTPIPDSDVLLSTNAWHNIILKANLLSLKYLSLQVNHLFFDLSDIDLRFTTPDAQSSRLLKQISIEAAGNAPTEILLDDIIIHEI